MALIHWVKRNGPGRLGIMARPGRADNLQKDLQEARDNGVEEIVSLLTNEDVEKFELQDERRIVEELGMKFLQFPIEDRGVPAANGGTMQFLRAREAELKKGRSIAVHCSSGRGRTGLVGASLMVMEGWDPDEAMKHVRGHRVTIVPDTPQQMNWVRDLADRLGVARKPKRPPVAMLLAAGVAVLGIGFGLARMRRR